jgi:hypothetical protein
VLYKVTPMLTPAPDKKVKAPRDPNAPKEPRKRRKSAVYDCDGNEVLITMMCLKCRAMKPLTQFGLRKMADGAIRNQPWCRGCRSGAGAPKGAATASKKELPVEVETHVELSAAEAEGVAPVLEASATDTTPLPADSEPAPA